MVGQLQVTLENETSVKVDAEIANLTEFGKLVVLKSVMNALSLDQSDVMFLVTLDLEDIEIDVSDLVRQFDCQDDIGG